MSLRGLRVLVTGSAGLVGSAVVEKLLAVGADVVGFDVVTPGRAGLDDVCDAVALERAIESCDGVIHLAAISRVGWGETHPELCRRTNVGGVEAVLAAIGARRRPPWLVFASSREVYGDNPSERVREDAPLEPVNVYGRSKADGERRVEAAARDGLRAAIVRLSSVYGGPRDHPDRAAPALVTAALVGRELVLTGADQRLDLVHVEDVADGVALAAAALAEGELVPPIHLATGAPTTLRALAETACAAAGSASRIVERPPRPFDVRGFCGDPSRAAEVLGWRAAIGMSDGVRRLVESIRRDGPPPPVQPPDPDALRRAAARTGTVAGEPTTRAL